MPNRVLIVGGCGYIGGYMTDLFESLEDYEVTVYDNLTYESRFLKPVNFVYGDVRDQEKLEKLLPEFDTVVWLAAIVGDGACAIDPRLTDEINYESVRWLVDTFPGKIVFTSTCSVYGVNHDMIDETAKPNPLSVYAETKLRAEQAVLERSDSLVFRLGTLFGLGDDHSRIRLDLVTNVLTMRAIMGETLTVFGGEQWRPLLHVKDVAGAVDYGLNNGLTGLYNLSMENYTIKGMAQEIANLVDGVDIEYVDMKFEDMRNYRVSNEKVIASGWRPRYRLDDGVVGIASVISEKRIVNVKDPVYSNVCYLKEIFSANN